MAHVIRCKRFKNMTAEEIEADNESRLAQGRLVHVEKDETRRSKHWGQTLGSLTDEQILKRNRKGADTRSKNDSLLRFKLECKGKECGETFFVTGRTPKKCPGCGAKSSILGCANLRKANTKKECEAVIMKTRLEGNKQYKWIFTTSGFPIIHPDDNLKEIRRQRILTTTSTASET